MNKSKVFISHITEEGALADVVKTQILQDFLGMLDVFVSSDQHTISVGSKWLTEIDDALKGAQVELILCSADSVKRPWVNFEAGAGWVKGIPIVPVCHTGMRLVDLPIPLNMLEGIVATERTGWERVYSVLASKLGSAVPKADFTKLVSDIAAFEHEYGLVRVVASAVRSLVTLLPSLEAIFKPHPANHTASGEVPDILLDKMKPNLQVLEEKEMLEFAIGNNAMVFGGGGGGGNVVELKIEILPAYEPIASKVFGP